MPNVTTADIITEEAIHRVVQDAVEENLEFRRAFRSLDVSDIDNDTIQLPKDPDNMGGPEEVSEGSEFPRDEEDIETVPATVQKYGFEVSVTRESEMDSVFEVVARQVEKQARRMAEHLNELAFEELNANLHPNSPAGGLGDTGKLEFQDMVDGRREMLDDGLSPEFAIVNVQGEADLLTSDQFLRATDFGDDTVVDADTAGRVAGMPVFVSNAGLMSSTDGEAIIVDPDRYGYEVVKEDVMTNEYDAPERQANVFQIWTRRTYKALDERAAIKVTS